LEYRDILPAAVFRSSLSDDRAIVKNEYVETGLPLARWPAAAGHRSLRPCFANAILPGARRSPTPRGEGGRAHAAGGCGNGGNVRQFGWPADYSVIPVASWQLTDAKATAFVSIGANLIALATDIEEFQYRTFNGIIPRT